VCLRVCVYVCVLCLCVCVGSVCAPFKFLTCLVPIPRIAVKAFRHTRIRFWLVREVLRWYSAVNNRCLRLRLTAKPRPLNLTACRSIYRPKMNKPEVGFALAQLNPNPSNNTPKEQNQRDYPLHAQDNKKKVTSQRVNNTDQQSQTHTHARAHARPHARSSVPILS